MTTPTTVARWHEALVSWLLIADCCGPWVDLTTYTLARKIAHHVRSEARRGW